MSHINNENEINDNAINNTNQSINDMIQQWKQQSNALIPIMFDEYYNCQNLPKNLLIKLLNPLPDSFQTMQIYAQKNSNIAQVRNKLFAYQSIHYREDENNHIKTIEEIMRIQLFKMKLEHERNDQQKNQSFKLIKLLCPSQNLDQHMFIPLYPFAINQDIFTDQYRLVVGLYIKYNPDKIDENVTSFVERYNISINNLGILCYKKDKINDAHFMPIGNFEYISNAECNINARWHNIELSLQIKCNPLLINIIAIATRTIYLCANQQQIQNQNTSQKIEDLLNSEQQLLMRRSNEYQNWIVNNKFACNVIKFVNKDEIINNFLQDEPKFGCTCGKSNATMTEILTHLQSLSNLDSHITLAKSIEHKVFRDYKNYKKQWDIYEKTKNDSIYDELIINDNDQTQNESDQMVYDDYNTFFYYQCTLCQKKNYSLKSLAMQCTCQKNKDIDKNTIIYEKISISFEDLFQQQLQYIQQNSVSIEQCQTQKPSWNVLELQQPTPHDAQILQLPQLKTAVNLDNFTINQFKKKCSYLNDDPSPNTIALFNQNLQKIFKSQLINSQTAIYILKQILLNFRNHKDKFKIDPSNKSALNDNIQKNPKEQSIKKHLSIQKKVLHNKIRQAKLTAQSIIKPIERIEYEKTKEIAKQYKEELKLIGQNYDQTIPNEIGNANIISLDLDIDNIDPNADDDVNEFIKNLSTSSAAGPSGIDGNYIKHMYPSVLQQFKKVLRLAFKNILANPRAIIEIPELYQYRSIFLPKSNNQYRHIAIQESILTGFHQLILKKIYNEYSQTLHIKQYATKKCAYIQCIKEAKRFCDSGLLLKLDIKKAFDSIPFAEIIKKMNELKMPANFIEYVTLFVQLRYSDLMGQAEKGVPQGDPLSMFLFCIVINPVLDKLTEHCIDFDAYADDQLILIPESNYNRDYQDRINRIINIMDIEYKKIGLELNIDKCKSTYTQNDELIGKSISEMNEYYFFNIEKSVSEIEFMNISFNIRDMKKPIAPKLIETIKSEINELTDMLNAKVDCNIIYHFLTKSSLAKVNYGPFIDDYNTKEQYQEIDQLIINFLKQMIPKLKQCPNNEILQFLISAYHAEGLQLILPGYYFDLMQKVAKSDIADTGKALFEYKEQRKKSLTEGNVNSKQGQCIAIHSFKNHYQLLNNQEFELAFSDIIEESCLQFNETQQKLKLQQQENQQNYAVCPCCGKEFNQNHEAKCVVINKTKYAQHQSIQAIIQQCIRKQYTYTKCITCAHLANDAQIPYYNPQYPTFHENEYEHSKKLPDFQIQEIQQAYDVTIRERKYFTPAYGGKVAKYKRYYFNKEVQPLVMSLQAVIHPDSLSALQKIANSNTLLPKLAARLIKSDIERTEAFKQANKQKSVSEEQYFNKKAANPKNTMGYHDTQKAIEIEKSLDGKVQQLNQASLDQENNNKNMKQNKQQQQNQTEEESTSVEDINNESDKQLSEQDQQSNGEDQPIKNYKSEPSEDEVNSDVEQFNNKT